MKKIMFSIIILCTIWITVSVINAEFFTDIEESAKSGNVKRLQTLVNGNSDECSLRIAVDFAVLYNRTEAFKFLLGLVDEKQYKYILDVALECGNIDATKLVLEKGGSITGIDKQLTNDLSFEMVKLLLNKGVVLNTDINLYMYTEEQRKEIISIAMKNKELVQLKFWNDAFRIAVEENDIKMVETLRRSIFEMVKPLLNKGVVLNTKINLYMYTQEQQKEIISIAMKNKELVQVEFWNDAFRIAVRENDIEMVEQVKRIILEMKNDKVVPLEFWNDAFCLALENNDQDMVEELKCCISKTVVIRALSVLDTSDKRITEYLLNMLHDLDDDTDLERSSIEYNTRDVFESTLSKTEKLDKSMVYNIVLNAIDENNPKVIDILSKNGIYVDKDFFDRFIYDPDIKSPEVYKKIFENYSEADLKEIKRNITIGKKLLEWFRFSEKKSMTKRLILLMLILQLIHKSKHTKATYSQFYTHYPQNLYTQNRCFMCGKG